MTRSALGAFVLLLAVLPAAVAGPVADPNRSVGRAVFLDPAFGGNEPGPMLDGKTAGKQVTLEIAKETYRALRAHNISVHLSRSRDMTVSMDKRLVKARKTGGELYISLRVSRDGRNCVQVAVPAFPASSPDESPDAYLMNVLWGNLQNKSGDLAELVIRSMKNQGVVLCGEMSVENDTALEKAMLPVVIVDWRTGGTNAAKSAPVDAALQKKVASALAEGIRGYSASSENGGRQER